MQQNKRGGFEDQRGAYSRGGRGRGQQQNYQVKGQARPETAYQRPANDEKFEQKERPQTASQRIVQDVQQERYRGGRGGRGRGDYQGGRGGRIEEDRPRYQQRDHYDFQKKQIDQSSWQYKYKNSIRPTYEKVDVTLDTEIPELPSQDEILKKPSKEDFDKKMKQMDKTAEQLIMVVKENKDKKRQLLETGKIDGNTLLKGQMGQSIEQVKQQRNQKRAHIDRLKILNEKIKELEDRRQQLMKNIPSHFKNEKEIQDEIKSRKRDFETRSLTAKEEQQFLREIDILEKAIPDIKKIQVLDPQLNEMKDEKKKIQIELDEIKKLIDQQDIKIDEVKKLNDAQKGKQTEFKEQLDKVQASIDKNNEEVTQLYKEKDQVREDYYKALLEFELQNDKIHHIKQMRNQQLKIKAVLEERAKRIEIKRQELEQRLNPNHKQIETCDQLIQYCNKLKAQHGLMPPTSEEVAVKTQKDFMAEYNKQDLEQKLKDKRIVAADSKKEVLTVIGKKGNKDKKQKTNQAQGQQKENFSIDFAVINKFNIVLLSPPIQADQLDQKIEELKQSQKKFIEQGEKDLTQQKDDLERDIIKQVEEEMEKERRDKERQERESYDDEEEKQRSDDRPYQRGRGGFGQSKAQKGRKYHDDDEEDQYQGKVSKGNEDEDQDEEEKEEQDLTSDIYNKPRKGGKQINAGRQQKQQKMALNDDDDFPNL